MHDGAVFSVAHGVRPVDELLVARGHEVVHLLGPAAGAIGSTMNQSLETAGYLCGRLVA